MVFICPVVILGKGKETMKHSFRKLLSVLLAAVMVFGGAASTVFAFNGEDFVPEIYDIDLKPVDGYFKISDRPGLGVELDEEAMAKYPYENIQYRPRYRADGSVAEI